MPVQVSNFKLKNPAGHIQLVFEVAPVLGVAMFTGQATQVEIDTAPIADEYLPTAQFRQVVLEAAATVSEYLPAAQSVQTAEPVTVLYFPATQAVHGPPSGPVVPAAQDTAG